MDVDQAPPRVSESDFGARKRINERSVPVAFRVVAVQGVIAAALPMVFLLQSSARAMSSLLAGIAMIAPNVFFAWRVAVKVPAGQEMRAARRLVASAFVKQLATVVLLVVAFAAFRPEPLGFFATMVAMQSVVWFYPRVGDRA